MTADQLNLLINILASLTLFEMMVAIGLGVTFADVLGVATDWRLVGQVSGRLVRRRLGRQRHLAGPLLGDLRHLLRHSR